ncbi:hypothetical protein N7486_002189 [Penicillium sp. IBT 16267x]|nr:hypothetical protein N7486_002189 [Penicillium sp. IBT 16267x]
MGMDDGLVSRGLDRLSRGCGALPSVQCLTTVVLLASHLSAEELRSLIASQENLDILKYKDSPHDHLSCSGGGIGAVLALAFTDGFHIFATTVCNPEKATEE